MLPRAAADVLPSTSDAHGGFKLTAILSLVFQHIQGIALTDARSHDRQALKLWRWLHGLPFLFDRGYSDYRLFDTISRRGGFFVTRLKQTASPVITAIRSGLGQAHAGSRFGLGLPFFAVSSTSTPGSAFVAARECCASSASPSSKTCAMVRASSWTSG